MKRQSILAIDSGFFIARGFSNGIHGYSLEKLYKEVDPYVSIRQREYLESNTNFRQVLPYKILTQMIDGELKIIAYRRLRKGGESRLYGLMSIGFGGHIDMEDTVAIDDPDCKEAASIIDLEATVRTSSRREIGEEVHYIDTHSARPYVPEDHEIVPTDLFIHYDLRDKLGSDWKVEDDVHSVHVAFVYTILAKPGLKFVSGEPSQIEMLPPMTPKELLNSDMEKEEWTRLLLEHMVH